VFDSDMSRRPAPMTALAPLRRHAFVLAATALIGLLGLNGVFLYYAFAEPSLVWDALANPVAAAFVGEAMLLTVVLAWVVHRLAFERLGALGFLLFSLVGSLAFSVPALLWLHLPDSSSGSADRPEPSE